MTIAAEKLRMGFPFPLDAYSSAPDSYAIDAAGKAVYFIFQAKKAVALTRAFLRCGAIAAAPTYRLSLQGVNTATGLPDGTIKVSGDGDPCQVVFNPTSLSWAVGRGYWQNWDVVSGRSPSYTPTRGELLALVVEYSSGTIGGSNYFSPSYGLNVGVAYSLPFPVTYDGATATKSARLPLFGYGSASEAFGFPIKSMALSSPALGTEWGVAFTVPTWVGDSARVAGGHIIMGAGLTTAKTLKIRLYGSLLTTPVALQELTLATDCLQALNANQMVRFWFPTTTLVDLTPGTEYGLAVWTEAALTNGAHQFTFESAADIASLDGGQGICAINRTKAEVDGGSAFTKTTTARYEGFDIMFDDFTASGGGRGFIKVVGGCNLPVY